MKKQELNGYAGTIELSCNMASALQGQKASACTANKAVECRAPVIGSLHSSALPLIKAAAELHSHCSLLYHELVILQAFSLALPH